MDNNFVIKMPNPAAVDGVGGAAYYRDYVSGKLHFGIALPSLPSFSSEAETHTYTTTTSEFVGTTKGQTTLEAQSVSGVVFSRDLVRRMEYLKSLPKPMEWVFITPEYMGDTVYINDIDYRRDETTTDATATMTITFTPADAIRKPKYNVKGDIAETVHFEQSLPSWLKIEEPTGALSINLPKTNIKDAQISVLVMDGVDTDETSSMATATIDAATRKLTITNKNTELTKKYVMLIITTSKEGCQSCENTIMVELAGATPTA